MQSVKRQHSRVISVELRLKKGRVVNKTLINKGGARLRWWEFNWPDSEWLARFSFLHHKQWVLICLKQHPAVWKLARWRHTSRAALPFIVRLMCLYPAWRRGTRVGFQQMTRGSRSSEGLMRAPGRSPQCRLSSRACPGDHSIHHAIDLDQCLTE